MMCKRSLADWLSWIQSNQIADMDLSLERVFAVSSHLGIKKNAFVITVGGTNGKGSNVAVLEAIYLQAGYRVGAFTSPILFKHNEYVRLQGRPCVDDLFCHAYEKIEMVKGSIGLTPFEYTALAAFLIFHEAHLDVWILEVGLGGRFDAVNIIDCDLALVSSIGIDHTEWLGETREEIGFEKAGIFRKNKPVVCGDIDPPVSLINHANRIKSLFYCQNKHFGFNQQESSWSWWSERLHLTQLPLGQLGLANVSSALMAVDLLQSQLPVKENMIRQALGQVKLIGRLQYFPGKIDFIFDVAHNPAAIEWLAQWLQAHSNGGQTFAVFSMLADKDIAGCLRVMKDHIKHWFVAPLEVKRGASKAILEKQFSCENVANMTMFNSIEAAYQRALNEAKESDRIVVFGSFHTVGCCINFKSSRMH